MSRIEDQVCQRIQDRALLGLNKYGAAVEREDLLDIDRLQHLLEELLDASVYLERLLDGPMSRIEDQVCQRIQARALLGLNKYGVTVEREDLLDIDWLQHLLEELLDASVYLERLLDGRRRARDV